MLEPPTLHVGQDMCAECSMIISEENHAGSISLIRDGRVVHLLFDDIGEMFLHDPGAYESIRWYVHDVETAAWLDAADATFLRSKGLTTPMATGVAAYTTRAAAEKARDEHGGELLQFADLRPAPGAG